MCGITGVLAARALDGEACGRRMAGVLRHRGPDDAGVWVDPAAGVVLAHRRLAILDLSPAGAQPMVSASGRYIVVYNGEMYNHDALRAELAALGAPPGGCRGHSDTEVLLAAVEAWGLMGALQRSVGMFALALWDRQERTLSLARDRLGEKPLYYGWMDNDLVFGSELAALRAYPRWRQRVDRTALDLLVRYDYIPAPFSIYENVRKLLPGTILTVRRGGELATSATYWSAKEVFEAGATTPFRGDDREAIVELERLVCQAITGQMIADVPLGAFLSGGLDSSTVVALMQAQATQPVRTFTIGFREDGYDEARYANAIAAYLGTDHVETYLTGADALGIVPTLPRLYDEPFADASQIPTALIARVARTYVTVCLSGDGGDELFGGYGYYRSRLGVSRLLARLPRWLRHPVATALTAASRLGGSGGATDSLHRLRLANLARRLEADSAEARYHASTSRWKERGSPVLGASAPSPPLTSPDRWAAMGTAPEMMMYQDAISYLADDILVKVDRATMSVSLESRTPYLDHRVVEFAARLPLSLKIRDRTGKWILRKVLGRHLPSALFDRPKHGFGPPIREWLQGPLRSWAEDLLDERRLRREGYLDAGVVRRLWSAFQAGAAHRTPLVWTIVMFQAWLAERDAEREVAPPAMAVQTAGEWT